MHIKTLNICTYIVYSFNHQYVDIKWPNFFFHTEKFGNNPLEIKDRILTHSLTLDVMFSFFDHISVAVDRFGRSYRFAD